MPALLREFEEAGISRSAVTVLLATGTHGRTPGDALVKKIGTEAAASCRLLVHDDRRDLVSVGRTSYGTPVLVNSEVLASDFVLGLGGIYPQHSTGFGGGSKIVLGVLGRRSITHLHYGHRSMEGSYEVDNDFRRDLDEIARAVGLRTSISVHLDARREVVRMVVGDHRRYYEEAVAFSMNAYEAHLPGDADVVISNAFPMDVSLTFMRSKGIVPLLHAAPHASRVVIAGCPEGVGHHGLFPFVDQPRLARARHVARHVMVHPSALPAKAARRVGRVGRRSGDRAASPDEADGERRGGRSLLYTPGREFGSLPREIPSMTAVENWGDIVERVRAEQEGRDELDVVVYPCAPLQVLDDPAPIGSITSPEPAVLD
jgi:nickel-dependent lactate racemase